jgi:hypothetical protein
MTGGDHSGDGGREPRSDRGAALGGGGAARRRRPAAPPASERSPSARAAAATRRRPGRAMASRTSSSAAKLAYEITKAVIKGELVQLVRKVHDPAVTIVKAAPDLLHEFRPALPDDDAPSAGDGFVRHGRRLSTSGAAGRSAAEPGGASWRGSDARTPCRITASTSASDSACTENGLGQRIRPHRTRGMVRRGE